MGLRFWAGNCHKLWGKDLWSGLMIVSRVCPWGFVVCKHDHPV